MTARIFGLVLGCLMMQSSSAAHWQKISAQLVFPPNAAPLSRLLIYQDNALSQTDDGAFTPISSSIRQALLAPQTENPFRTRLPKLYQARAGLANCPMVMTTIDLDNQADTQEYWIAYSRLRCFVLDEAERLRQADNQPHYVLLQKKANGTYRVLMESDGSLSIINQLSSGYKTLESKIMLAREFPNHTLQCGGAELGWRYEGKAYRLSQVDYVAHDCEPRHFPNLSGSDWEQAYARYQQQIMTVLKAVIQRFD